MDLNEQQEQRFLSLLDQLGPLPPTERLERIGELVDEDPTVVADLECPMAEDVLICGGRPYIRNTSTNHQYATPPTNYLTTHDPWG